MNILPPRVRAIDVFLVMTIGLAVALWIQASSLKPPFDIYPKMVIMLVGLLSVICLIQNITANRSVEKLDKNYSLWSFLATIGGIIIYIIAIDFVGYFSSTLIYLCLFFFFKRIEIDGWTGVNAKGIALDFAIASIVTTVVAIVFKIGLKLVFPEALFF